MKNSKKNVFIDRSIMSINLLLKEIEKYEVLSQEEEYNLWKQMREGKDIARKQLINSNLRFVMSRAICYLWSGVPLEDLFQAGSVGLMVAIDMFDASLGVKLISFAVYYIDCEIQKMVTSHLRFSSSVSLSDAAFNDEDCKLTMEDVLSSGRQDYADWSTRYDSAFQYMKAVVKKVAPFKEAAQLWEDNIYMKEQGYSLSDVARKYHITEEQAKDKIKAIENSLRIHYGLRV
jgi:RNA polymerase sigma factor (sigma-70 family)